ncbi:EipB family protein [Afipia carboxidovorans]|uniref:EipB family protein n=1 Tax=Afipia carboxidovorans TaxID=40137 RepID=UPI0030CACB01
MTDDIRQSRTQSRIWLLAGSIALSAVFTAQAQPHTASAVDITPFKAVYKLDFGPSNDKSPFKSGQGRLTVEFTGSRCTDYRMIRTVNARLTTIGEPLTIQSEATFAENAASSQLAFSMVERNNGKVSRQYNLIARKNDSGGATVRSGSLPGGKADLPKGTLFPIEHERAVIAAASAGNKTLATTFYNPEESIGNIEQMSYTFGPESKTALPKGHPADIEALRNQTRQRVQAIFRTQKTGKIRVRESMTSFNNGILTVSDALFEQLRIKASLQSLTMLPKQACS